VISPVDPCSASTAKADKRVQFGYALNYLIDRLARRGSDCEPPVGSMTVAPFLYRASKHDCTSCPLKPMCAPNAPQRKIRVM
jgi:hypothetical protein